MPIDRTKYNPDIPPPSDSIKTSTGLVDADTAYKNAFGRALLPHTDLVVRITSKGIRTFLWSIPGVARDWIAARSAEAFTDLFNKDSEHAERLLNQFNEAFTASDDEVQRQLRSIEKGNPDIEQPLPFTIPDELGFAIRDFGKDIRDRALPLLPPPKVIEADASDC